MTYKGVNMREDAIEKTAQKIRDDASRYASTRLSRGSIRIQEGAFATSVEWNERGVTQAERVSRINCKLKINI